MAEHINRHVTYRKVSYTDVFLLVQNGNMTLINSL